MQKYFFLTSAIAFLFTTQTIANTLCYRQSSCPLGYNQCPQINVSLIYCEQRSSFYWGSNQVITCDVCPSGFLRVQKSVLAPGCSNEVTYYECQEPCTGCNNCVSDTDWSEPILNTGVQQKATRKCVCNTCNATYEYRCVPGYYGSPTGTSMSDTICTSCPSQGTSAAASKYITQCYEPTGTTHNDNSGTFSWTNNCYYSGS